MSKASTPLQRIAAHLQSRGAEVPVDRTDDLEFVLRNFERTERMVKPFGLNVELSPYMVSLLRVSGVK